MKKCSVIFFNGAVVLSAMLLTLFILDLLNPNMNFLDGAVSKIFLGLFCAVSAGAGICGIAYGVSHDEE